MNNNYNANAYKEEGIVINDINSSLRFVILGDSHGVMWSNQITNISHKLNATCHFFTMSGGQSPFFKIPIAVNENPFNLSSEEQLHYDEARLNIFTKYSTDLVIISARWNNNHINESKDLMNYLSLKNIPVLLLECPPILKMGNQNVRQYLHWKKLDNKTSADNLIALECYQLNTNQGERFIVRKIANKYPNARLFPTYDLYLHTFNKAKVVINNEVLYLDDDHLTKAGTEIVSTRLIESIKSATDIAEFK